MNIAKSNIVRSTAGRDEGDLFFVLDVVGEFLLLADGKTRRVEHPKRKKMKHTKFVCVDESGVAEKIINNEKVTNSELRKAIAVINSSNHDQEVN